MNRFCGLNILFKLSIVICFTMAFNNCMFASFADGKKNSLHLNNDYDKIYTISKLWSEVKSNFVGIDRISFDIDSFYVESVKRVMETSNDIEFYDEIQRFLAAFGDGHTELIDYSYEWSCYFDYIPANVKLFEDGFYFTAIRKNNGLDSTLLGSKIEEIYGIPIEQYIKDSIFPYVSHSTNVDLYKKSELLLQQGVKGERLWGKSKKSNGDIVRFDFLFNGEKTRLESDEYWGRIERKSKDLVTLDIIDNIAVFKINKFYPEKIVNLIDSCACIINNSASGLIIDLRNNKGGDTDIAEYLQMYISPLDTFLSIAGQMRINNGYYRSQGNYIDEYNDYYLNKAYQIEYPDTIKRESHIKAFNMPTVILIGRNTYSACEDLLVGLSEIPNRPLYIGEETSGSTGAPLVISLPHGAKARVCTYRDLYPYSLRPFVGGIKPDITVETDINSYMRSIDVVLNRAKNIINEIIERRCEANEKN